MKILYRTKTIGNFSKFFTIKINFLLLLSINYRHLTEARSYNCINIDQTKLHTSKQWVSLWNISYGNYPIYKDGFKPSC